MDLRDINELLFQGNLDSPGVLPHLKSLKDVRHVFQLDFGLNKLPEDPGLLLIRGPRQYGKSTWLESEIKKTIHTFGKGTAFYLNGDEIRNDEEFSREIETLIPLFRKDSRVKRLFLDEVTAVPQWEKALKRLLDRGLLKEILVVSTGSKATDLRKGAERLPGRKGKLKRTNYLFTPISFSEFKSKCGDELGDETLDAYIMSGGCPIACSEIASSKKLPDYVVQMVRDWIYGECSITGRNRSSLLAVMDILLTFGGSQVGQTKLAQESGLANNTVAAGYIEFLADLLVVAPSYAWHASKHVALRRKPSKFHFTNTLAAVAWHSSHPYLLDEFKSLNIHEKSKFYEWAVAQEVMRRRSILGEDIPEQLCFWRDEDHEIDFVLTPHEFLEVKTGGASPFDFSWFPKIFPNSHLDVINTNQFETETIRGQTLENFLLR